MTPNLKVNEMLAHKRDCERQIEAAVQEQLQVFHKVTGIPIDGVQLDVGMPSVCVGPQVFSVSVSLNLD